MLEELAFNKPVLDVDESAMDLRANGMVGRSAFAKAKERVPPRRVMKTGYGQPPVKGLWANEAQRIAYQREGTTTYDGPRDLRNLL